MMEKTETYHKGLTEQKVRDALDEQRTVYGAASELGVTRQTIYDWMWRKQIPHPETGHIPDYSDDE